MGPHLFCVVGLYLDLDIDLYIDLKVDHVIDPESVLHSINLVCGKYGQTL